MGCNLLCRTTTAQDRNGSEGLRPEGKMKGPCTNPPRTQVIVLFIDRWASILPDTLGPQPVATKQEHHSGAKGEDSFQKRKQTAQVLSEGLIYGKVCLLKALSLQKSTNPVESRAVLCPVSRAVLSQLPYSLAHNKLQSLGQSYLQTGVVYRHCRT